MAALGDIAPGTVHRGFDGGGIDDGIKIVSLGDVCNFLGIIIAHRIQNFKRKTFFNEISSCFAGIRQIYRSTVGLGIEGTADTDGPGADDQHPVIRGQVELSGGVGSDGQGLNGGNGLGRSIEGDF